jgi:hypothetical protein
VPFAVPNTSAVAAAFTPGNAITVTRVEAQALVAPAGCRTNLMLQLSDGTPAGTTSLPVATARNDSGVLAIPYAAGTPVQLTVLPPAGCSTAPASSMLLCSTREDKTRQKRTRGAGELKDSGLPFAINAVVRTAHLFSR